MTVNKFFDNQFGVGSEQDLSNDLIIEMIQLSGRDYFYIPRSFGNIDQILGEITNASFTKFSTIEMYLNNYADLAGNNLLASQFGLIAQNTAEFVVSRTRFMDILQDWPRVGDLVYDSLTKLIFQIDYVDSEPSPSYQLQQLYTYTLKCSLFTYNHEDFASGIPKVDEELNPSTFVDVFENGSAILQEAELDISEIDQNPFGDILADSNGQ